LTEVVQFVKCLEGKFEKERVELQVVSIQIIKS
jgi:phosphoheptose isomerase